jgi:alkylhydroperoxidase family enzyme
MTSRVAASPADGAQRRTRPRARLASILAEQGTRIADAAGGVTDEAWANAAKYYDTDQLAALVCIISYINAYNRLNVISQNQGGDYQPGQWA